jgi:hypothetical protein
VIVLIISAVAFTVTGLAGFRRRALS